MGKITLNHITKIEGHARLDLEVDEGKLKKCQLGSIEGSRYFEGLLVGRMYNEAQEISTRICGICSSAHNIAAIMAIENAIGVQPSKQTVILRNLQTIGERIRSHATHLYFLALPDYLGFESALEMAPKLKKEVQRALRLMKLGNDIVTLVSGRVIHPIAPTIGGFLHIPKQTDLESIRKRLEESEEDIMETAKLVAGLKIPEFVRPTKYMCIVKEDQFGMSQGDIKISNQVVRQDQLHKFTEEYHEKFSTANFVVTQGHSYSVGALARVNNNQEKLSPAAREFIQKNKFKFPSDNPFLNNLCQAIELIHYREECISLLKDFKVNPDDKIVHYEVKAGHGIAANEAPRGTLWHEYKVDEQGVITYANIITPTAQSLRNINEDIAAYVQQMLDKNTGKDEMVLEIEKLIRSYDPCFSCSSHFLKVNWKGI